MISSTTYPFGALGGLLRAFFVRSELKRCSLHRYQILCSVAKFGFSGAGAASGVDLSERKAVSPADVADGRVLPELLHGKETRVWGDQAYRGQRAAIRQKRRGRRISPTAAVVTAASPTRWERAKNRSKSKVPAKVEHSIGVIKRVFGFAKVRYRGLKKNEHRLIVTCALANLFIVRRQLLRLGEA